MESNDSQNISKRIYCFLTALNTKSPLSSRAFYQSLSVLVALSLVVIPLVYAQPSEPISVSKPLSTQVIDKKKASPTAQKNTNGDIGFDEGGFDEGGFDEGGFDEGGFGSLDTINLKTTKLPPPPSALRIDGFVRSQWASWVLRPFEDSWAKGRQNLDLSAKYKKDGWLLTLDAHLEYDLLYDLDDSDFDQVQIEEYRMRYIPGVQSVSKRFSLGHVSLSLSTGRQIITWGESDGLSALDLINPQDQREPGVADIDDMKLAVWLSRLQMSHDKHSLEFIVRHEGNYGILVPPRADYSPFNAIMDSQSAMLPSISGLLDQINSKEFRFAHENEGVSANTQSYFLRYLYRGEGFDLGLYAASLLDLQGVIGQMDIGQLLNMNSNQVSLTYQHPRYTLTGLTLALPLGNWLFKGELVGSLDKPVNVGEDFNDLAIAEVNLLTHVFGLTYSGFTDTSLSLEYQGGQVIAQESDLTFFIPPNLDILAMRVNHTFGRERFTAGAILSMIVPQWSTPSQLHQPKRGGLFRLDFGYRVLDQLKVGLGYVHYLTGEEFGPFYGLEKHDRLFAQLRWDFTVY